MGQRTIGSLAGGGTEGGREEGREVGKQEAPVGVGKRSGRSQQRQKSFEQQHSARNGCTPNAGTCSHTVEPSYT